jgi:ribosomal protein S18 acetylase RimI-like enzyme
MRHLLRPGDIGCLTHLHGTVYARECGYNIEFEAYVASGLAEFIRLFKQEKAERGKDRIWLVEAKNHIIGSIAIVGRSTQEAQLRWFFVHPDYRGRGIGRRLLTEALHFSRRRRYKTIFLWTTSELDAARHLYLDAGFKKTDEKKHRIWGKTVREERYDLRM